jgi:group I intron endonuclease
MGYTRLLLGIPEKPGVYALRNTVNGKVYVGSSKEGLRQRLLVHRRSLRAGTHVNKHLQHAWNSHGDAAFEFVVLKICKESRCLYWEQKYLDKYKSYNRVNGYNGRPKASNNAGYKHTEDFKRAISLRGKLRYRDPLERRKTGDRAKVMWQDPIIRKKIIKGLKAALANPATKERVCAGLKRKATRDKITAALRTKNSRERSRANQLLLWSNPAYKRKMKNLHKERCKRQDELQRLSEQARRYYSLAENRKKKSEEVKAAWKDPTYREKMLKARMVARAKKYRAMVSKPVRNKAGAA